MQLKYVKEPFGEVNIYPGKDGTRVVATILMEPEKEGTQTGIAIDASGSMKKNFGVGEAETGGFLSSIFGGGKPKLVNEVAPIAQNMCSYLAEKLDADGGTTAIYWACPPKGKGVQLLGDLTATQAKEFPFNPPKTFGAETHLLPAVEYFINRFYAAPWGFYVFITDGVIHDLEKVKIYSRAFSKAIVAGKMRPVKLVLVGLGDDVDERQMVELDDLDTEVDLWDHKIAKEMRLLQEVFAEVVDKNARIADKGKILDPTGKTIKDYSDTGLPPYLEFNISNDAASFILEVNGTKITQPLEGAYRP